MNWSEIGYRNKQGTKECFLVNKQNVLYTIKLQKINAKLHDGVCQRCKEVLEWRVKYSKYKPLSKPKKCVKCLQKTVKDSYHIMCRPCACELEVCAKCGKKEDIVIPLNKETEKIEHTENNLSSNHRRSCRRNEESDDDLDFDIDLEDTGEHQMN
ncbi:uncharacterized protein C9orf85 homolog isoform X3 [Symphalangus syndactylus]|uniref:uncharacterized protein C9orf85 homolog isoform X3 n=1 Tax=Symphalangus syndactylus TaxID=9590 RepID=UPI002443240E|nr:uncharacterized protein C9orf85 homolog isoform X2 [Symphalangus syndactylus]XP_055128239.1 uncharacterized protein C9orf85 homolog isoform X2 [Symphalangus syndactylus]